MFSPIACASHTITAIKKMDKCTMLLSSRTLQTINEKYFLSRIQLLGVVPG
jgi:hypothetical protein